MREIHVETVGQFYSNDIYISEHDENISIFIKDHNQMLKGERPKDQIYLKLTKEQAIELIKNLACLTL